MNVNPNLQFSNTGLWVLKIKVAKANRNFKSDAKKGSETSDLHRGRGICFTAKYQKTERRAEER